MPVPNVIIAGAPKCGTTSIFNWMSDHPEVCSSSIKETCFFMDEEYTFLNKIHYREKGIDQYEAYFAHCDLQKAKVILEATPHYLYQKTALESLSNLKPRPKIIFILRKPSERVYSLYQFTKHNLAVLDKGISFKEFLGLLKSDPQEVLKKRALLRRTLEHSRYVEYMPPWIDRFGRENVHLFFFERLIADSTEFMKKMSGCLEIDACFWDNYSYTSQNETFQVRNQKLHLLKRALGGFLPKSIKTAVKGNYRKLNVEKKSPKSTDDLEVLAELDKEFQPYNDRLAEVLKVDLSIWRS